MSLALQMSGCRSFVWKEVEEAQIAGLKKHGDSSLVFTTD